MSNISKCGRDNQKTFLEVFGGDKKAFFCLFWCKKSKNLEEKKQNNAHKAR